MTDAALNRYELLGGVLIWAAIVTLGMFVLAAMLIMTSEDLMPYLGMDVLQRQGRAIVGLLTLGGGVAAAGVLAGLGGLIRLLVVAQRDV